MFDTVVLMCAGWVIHKSGNYGKWL